MQILVVVANTKESTFWAEVEQGFHRTTFGMKLVGPKEGGEGHIKSKKRWQHLYYDPPKGNGFKITQPSIP